MNTIASFSGQYRFLSNFYPAPVILDGVTYPSVEHAYVAAKTTDTRLRAQVLECETGGEAKRLGRRLPLRVDWESVKLNVMEDLLRQKFAHAGLRSSLLATVGRDLVEGNTWGDRFWGVCRGEGENNLGRLLMKVRDELRVADLV